MVEIASQTRPEDMEIQENFASNQESSVEIESYEISQESSMVMVEMASEERSMDMEIQESSASSQ